MTIGAAEPIFIDTNVLVRAAITAAPSHAAARAALHRLRRQGVPRCLSRQIMREYLATLSRPQPYSQPPAPAQLVRDVRYFERNFRIFEDSPDVTTQLLSVLQQIPVGGKQIHDANVVATMLAYGVQRLLTNNVDDFNCYSGLITLVPLR
jgi:predicted nucleic acid-binding protein